VSFGAVQGIDRPGVKLGRFDAPPSYNPRVRAALRRGANARHAAALLLFAALAVAWTWPLARHLGDALAGPPGDNYSFVWNLWWMRYVLATPGVPYFHTTFLFYPFGASIANHPHTALPALAAATLLGRWSVVEAQNLLLIGYVFANLAAMYALAWRATGHGRASILAAIVFGLSPYLAVHLQGHFDLVAAWPLPLYALALGAALRTPPAAAGHQGLAGIPRSAFAAGAIFAATAYIAYYYVVYLALFTVVYAVASTGAITIGRAREARPVRRHRVAIACAAAANLCALIALAIVVTGGATASIAGIEISARAPQNALTAMWIALAGWAVAVSRRRLRVDLRSDAARRARPVLAGVAITFAVLASPLVWQAASLVRHGGYVTPDYGWRSIPHGVDLLAPFFGHPLHPLFRRFSADAYAALDQDFVEVVGWFGVVPLALFIMSLTVRQGAVDPAHDADASAPVEIARERRDWRAVAAVFAIWSLGPFLTIAGFDVGLKLPAILLRFVPFVANARMPGRAIVMVFLAGAMLIAYSMSSPRGRLRSPVVQWVLVAVVAFEYWAGPLALTPLDQPGVYAALAQADPGAVCEVPLGIGDGLSAGVGSQERRSLFYATQHHHPLVGGYIGRMPADAARRYRQMPIAGTLLTLSDGAPAGTVHDVDISASPCRYLVVHRSAASAAVLTYVAGLRAHRLMVDGDRELYRLW
jgi:hypothetical protein